MCTRGKGFFFFLGLTRIILQDPLLGEIHCFLTQTRAVQTMYTQYFKNFLQPNRQKMESGETQKKQTNPERKKQTKNKPPTPNQ